MDLQLHSLLEQCTKQNILNDSKDTHVSFYGPARGWSIPSSAMGKFWDTYCSRVHNDFQEKFYVGEKVEGVAPVTAFLTFKFKNSDDVHYDEQFTNQLIATFQAVLEQTLTLKENDLVCVLLENDSPTKDGDHSYIKMRLQFPRCRVNITHQYLIKAKIVDQLRQDKALSHLTPEPIDNQWDRIIDMSFKEAIPLYGSTKSPSESKMKLSKIQSKFENDESEALELEDVLYPENHRDVKERIIGMETVEDRVGEKGLEFYLPLFLSMYYQPTNELFVKQSIAPKQSKRYGKIPKDEKDIDPREFLSIIKPKRLTKENQHCWLDIGRALYNIYDGDSEGLDIWVEFSERAKCFDREDCDYFYWSFDKNNYISIKTLAWFAYKDNETEYENVMNPILCYWLTQSLNQAHTDVAQFLYYCSWLRFLFEGKFWYRYENHRWSVCESEGIAVSKYISTEFMRKYEEVRADLTNQKLTSVNEDERTKMEEKIEKLSKMISCLKNMSFKTNVKKALSEFAYVEHFRRAVDSNPDYIGCTNGVIEIIDKTVAKHREGKPEDFITMTTGIPYRELSWNDPKVLMLEKWLSQVFVDKELRHHFYKDCASFLYGRNAEKMFRIYSGGGNNSKSMIMKLQQQTFGQYACDLPITLITGQRTQSSGPTPELAQAKGTHVGFLAEPDQEDQMKGGTIKALTGGDRFFARMLNDNGGSIEATFKLVLACNRIPSIVGDKALRNRIRVIPFLSTWVENAPDTEEEQYRSKRFKIDYDFERKIPMMTQSFLWIMVQMYETYTKEGLKDPEIVTEMTNKYWDDTDPYDNFVKDKISFVYSDAEKKTADRSCHVSFKSLFDIFKIWYKSNNPNQKVPASNFCRQEIINRIGAPSKDNRWYGISLIDDSD